ncbi:TPA: DUF4238 domain-containing protein [Vibrio parahaemolyticus]|nr:DUF4238 domain-containing protein [Vibrio parahaemolyticus]
MSQLTKRQHFVARTYLKGWSEGRWELDNKDTKVFAHNLSKNNSFPVNPEKILLEKWFYEEDSSSPNNEIENKFCDYEGNYAKTMSFLDFVINNALTIARESNVDEDQYLMRTIVSMNNTLEKHSRNIKQFAAISYFRTPAALKQKICELVHDKSAKETIEKELTAYDLSKFAFDSDLIERFSNLNMKFLISKNKSFITSDRPCFDLDSDAKLLPLLGYDIGRNNKTFAVMPLSTNLAILLLPPKIEVKASTFSTKPHDALILKDLGVDYFNEIILSKADQWVISNNHYSKLTEIGAVE